MEREFFDWGAPPLESLRKYLRRFKAEQHQWDLSRLLIVLPTASARHRLKELLFAAAANEGLIMQLPEIVTVGDLPEWLYQPQRRFAGENAQTFAWVRAMEKLTAEELALLTPQPPLPGQLAAWLDLGEVLKRLHRELSSQRLNFADVLKRLTLPEEIRRWEVLFNLQEKYHAELDAVELWDRQTARRVAIEKQELKTKHEILLAFCVDINETQRAMLKAVADRVKILIGAPPHLRDGFDKFGCLRYDFWRELDLDVHDHQLRIASGAADQAAAVCELIAELPGGVICDEVAISLADPELVPIVDEHLRTLGLGMHWNAGEPVLQSAPALLLAAIADCLEHGGFSDFARLARHPHLSSIVGVSAEDQHDWLSHFDQFATEHLPVRLDRKEIELLEEGARLAGGASAGFKQPSYLAPLKQWREAVDHWLAPLVGSAKYLSEWREPMIKVLHQVYAAHSSSMAKAGTAEADHEGQNLWEACRLLVTAIERATDVPRPLDRKLPAAHAIRTALDAARGQGITEPVTEYAIAGIGWLDTALNDLPQVILTGLADGIVPQMVAADPFLPTAMRKQLNLEDNDRRHGRDAYALQLTLNSGRNVRIVVGRIDVEGRPIAPSRLLLARPPEEVPQRVLDLYEPKAEALQRRIVLPRQESKPTAQETRVAALRRPLPVPGALVEKMSVTSFGDYIRCPYRFYLRHVVRLRPQDDQMDELDPRQVGNLIHDTLEAFGRNPDISQSRKPEEIHDFLCAELDHLVRCRFGDLPNAAVAFQVEQTRRRLEAAAEKQAQWAREGWEIWKVELPIEFGSAKVPGTEMPLIGRIDRIDYHPEKKRWAVLDYKTGAAGKGPKQAHFKGDKWQSLQLPLYRHMIPDKDPELIDVGYFLLPPKAAETGVALADFTAQELVSADAKAKEITEAVLSGIFWPPREPYEGFDDFAVLCQSRAQVRPVDEATL